MRGRPASGERLLREAGREDSEVLHVVRHHHERTDGNGHPDRLAAEALPRANAHQAVCDVYDAITSNRPWNDGRDPAESLRRMASWQGHFDPLVLKSPVRVLGIYPVGSLVWLASDFLAVVVAPGGHPWSLPVSGSFFPHGRGPMYSGATWTWVRRATASSASSRPTRGDSGISRNSECPDRLCMPMHVRSNRPSPRVGTDACLQDSRRQDAEKPRLAPGLLVAETGSLRTPARTARRWCAAGSPPYRPGRSGTPAPRRRRRRPIPRTG